MSRYPQVTAFAGDAGTIRVVGHRGARGILPENSMMGFDFALSIGVDLLEFDVLLTRDDIPVITHNHEFHGSAVRGPDGAFLNGVHPRVASLTMAEIERFDIGSNADTEYGCRSRSGSAGRCCSTAGIAASVSQPGYETACLMLELKRISSGARRQGTRHRVDRLRRSSGGRADRADAAAQFRLGAAGGMSASGTDMPLSFLTQLQDKGHDIGEESSILSRRLDNPDISVPDEVSKAGGCSGALISANWCGAPRARELGLTSLSDGERRMTSTR